MGRPVRPEASGLIGLACLQSALCVPARGVMLALAAVRISNVGALEIPVTKITMLRHRAATATIVAAMLTATGCGGTVLSPPGAAQSRSIATGSGGTNRPEHVGKPYVILISFDGFRADYLDRYAAPNFQRVARMGVRARGLIPAFPSKTFPNHYSIVTGQYPERHGIVANRFYDPARGRLFALGDTLTVFDGSWYRGEPIWVTAEKQGMVTASYFWVGTEAPIKGIRPTLWKKFDTSVPNSSRVDSALAWLEMPAEQRPHLITLYMSTVDNAGHRYGPDDPRVGNAILAVDSALGRLLDGIERLPIRGRVNLILVSDHGMSSVTPETTIPIETLIDTTGVIIGDIGPNANLHVAQDRSRAKRLRDSLNLGLRNGRAYLRSEVPARLRYRDDPRIGDVVIIMDEHYVIGRRARMPSEAGGTHGWNPAFPSMHGIFLAMGPGMRAGASIPSFENVHIYPLLAETLGIRSAPHVQGRAGWLRKRILQ